MDGPANSFRTAARLFADLVARLPDDRWEGPGLGEWDLRALVGHTSRSLTTVETYLARPAAAETLPTPERYLAAAREAVGQQAGAIAERGREAGRALGDHPAAAVATLLDRVLPLVEPADDPLLETALGGMRLSAYLPTRTFELVVHSLDIVAATGTPLEVGDDLLAEVTGLAARAAAVEGQGVPVVRALTGRARLPEGFSVV